MFEYYIDYIGFKEDYEDFCRFIYDNFNKTNLYNLISFKFPKDKREIILEKLTDDKLFIDAIFIIKNDRFRFGRYYKIKDSKVVIIKKGNILNYNNFLKEINIRDFKYKCKRCGESYNTFCPICKIKRKEVIKCQTS